MNNVTRMPSAGAGRLAKSMRGAGSVMVALHSAALADNGRGPGQVQQKSGRASPAISFVYLSAECLFNKFYGINCRPKFDTKLLDRFLSSPVAGLPTSQQPETLLLGRFPACPLLQFHDRFSPWRCRLFIEKTKLSS